MGVPVEHSLKRNARALRLNMTDVEKKLWQEIRHRQVHGARFRRQVPLGNFIVDFACLQSRLIIEVDGGQHNGSSSDQKRDAWLEAQGFRVLRFWNNDVQGNLEGVLQVIANAFQQTPPSNLPPSRGKAHSACSGSLSA